MFNFLRIKKTGPIFLVLALSWFSVAPLFQPGFFPVHDDTQMARVWEMAKAIQGGQFPVRLVADLGYGYGYPLFNYYAPLPYYFGAFLNLIGAGLLVATKLMFLTGILLAPILMYWLVKEFWGKTGGVLGALFYLYAPYHALDVYVRGAVGEFWAMAFLPLVFLVLTKIGREREKRFPWIALGGVAYAGLILSHNLTVLMATPFLLAWAVFWILSSQRPRRIIGNFLLVFGLGLLLAAFYWLPAIGEIGFIDADRLVAGEGGDFRHHFVFLDQLWDSPWGFAGSGPGRADGMSFKIGKLHLVVAFLSLGLALFKRKRKKEEGGVVLKTVAFLTGAIGLAAFFTLRASQPLWETLPGLPFLQYPWRFLTLVTFFVSWLAGGLCSEITALPKRGFPLVLGILILGLVGFQARYFQPQEFSSPDRDYRSFETLAWEASKRSDEYLPAGFSIPRSFDEVPQEKIVFEEGEGEISDPVVKSDGYSFKVRSGGVAGIRINSLHFPGFRAWVDGQEVELERRGDKLIGVRLDPGEHRVVVKLTNTRIRNLGNWLSVVAAGVLVGGVLKYQHGKKPKGKGRT